MDEFLSAIRDFPAMVCHWLLEGAISILQYVEWLSVRRLVSEIRVRKLELVQNMHIEVYSHDMSRLSIYNSLTVEKRQIQKLKP